MLHATLHLAFISFATPWLAAAGAAAVAIPILIHLLSRIRRKPQPWGAMRFLQMAYKKHRRRMNLENLLLLLVRCLVLLLLGAAVAGPMLSGLAGRLGGPFDRDGRVIHIVMDDGLTTRGKLADGTARFDVLRATARELVEGAGPNDRVALWRGGRPGGAFAEGTGTPTRDHALVLKALDDASPRYGGSDLPAALERVSQSLIQQDVPAGMAVVTVVSDFARAADYLQQPVDPELERLGERATVVIAKPQAGRANVQVRRVTPRRSLIVAEEGPAGSGRIANVAATVELERFSDAAESATVEVNLAVRGRDGKTLASEARRLTFAPGQTRLASTMELPVELTAAIAAEETLAGRVVVLAATLSSDDAARMGDSLTEDNTALATLILRPQLVVAVADEGSTLGGELGQGRWLTMALRPLTESTRGPVALRRVLPSALNAKMLKEIDAVLLTRPDLVSGESWLALADHVRRGGLVWVFPPTGEAAESPTVWFEPMRGAFDLPWRVRGDVWPTGGAAQPAALAGETAVPEALSILSADWEALLKPIRVQQRLILGGGDAASSAWLRTQDASLDAAGEHAIADSGALLVARAWGAGSLLLSTVAIQPDWTNLPTKPLLVPLVHETLRGLMGKHEPGAGTQVAGEAATLGPRWIETVGLERIWPAPEAQGDLSDTIALEPAGDGVRTQGIVARPGVYVPTTKTDDTLQLTVNIDHAAGDLRSVPDETLAVWLDGLGDWDFLDTTDPAAVFATQQTQARFGWPLLWCVLALLVLETVLARRFSHAESHERVSLLRRVARGLTRVQESHDQDGRRAA